MSTEIQLPADKEQLPVERLREFIGEHLHGNCKMLSQGDNCKCPLCDLDRLQGALHWYADEAEAIHKNLVEKKEHAVLASVNVLSLDSGRRSREVIGERKLHPCFERKENGSSN